MHRPIPSFAEARVLLVEDEPLILMDCEAILRSIGIQSIVGVTNAKDAISALDASPDGFDVAVLDISLHGSSSLPLAQILAERGVRTGFMSGYSPADLPEPFRGAPYVSKPFIPGQLRTLLENLLQSMPKPG